MQGGEQTEEKKILGQRGVYKGEGKIGERVVYAGTDPGNKKGSAI